MPDHMGRFSQEDYNKINAWFKGKWKMGACSVCGVTDWSIEEYLANAPIVRFGMVPTLGANTYPFVLVICKNCGHTVFMNAVSIGIVRQTGQ